MSPEIYTIVAVAIALAGLIMNGHGTLRALMGDLRQGLNGIRSEVAAMRNELRRDNTGLSEPVARLEGLVDGIRDTIAARAA